MKEKLSTDTLSESADGPVHAAVAENLRRIRERAAELEEAGRGRFGKREIKIAAATKTVPAETINFAVRKCGLSDIGENRVQELLGKYGALDRESGLNIHFIGKLQANKVKYVIDKVCLIHSLDSLELAREISRQAEKRGLEIRCLIEINIGREANKSGVLPERAEEFACALREIRGLKLAGVMTMAPRCREKREYAEYFGEAYRIFDALRGKYDPESAPLLSMGMSDSYETAIECGSNLIRPGTAIFGTRAAVGDGNVDQNHIINSDAEVNHGII